MKISFIKIITMAALVMVFNFAKADPVTPPMPKVEKKTDWVVLYPDSTNGDTYYKPKSLKKDKGNYVILVGKNWLKYDYQTNKSTPTFYINEQSIDCVNKTFRIIKSTSYYGYIDNPGAKFEDEKYDIQQQPWRPIDGKYEGLQAVKALEQKICN